MRNLPLQAIPLAVIGGSSEPAPGVPAGKRRALLVGCNRYPLSDRGDLEAPGNDVLLVRQLLIERFDFAARDIVTLSDAEGKKDAKYLPTRAHIERECKRLAGEATAGDQVVVLLAGHGDLSPEKFGVADAPPDDLLSVFIPRDTGKKELPWKVPNAITGQEFASWVRPVLKKNASLWLLYDASHGGGFGREICEHEDWSNDSAQGGVALLHACRANESLPRRGAGTHGLFALSLCQILRTGQPMTYVQLAQRIQSRYPAEGREPPHPAVLGKNRARLVLEERTAFEQSEIVLFHGFDGFGISAGSLAGLREGTILAVRPPGKKSATDEILGHVRVTATTESTARVEPCAHARMDVRWKMPNGSPCQPVYLPHDSPPLRLALPGIPREASLAARLDHLEKQLRERLDRPGSPCRLVSAEEKPDWFVKVTAGKEDALYLWTSVTDPGRQARPGEVRGPFTGAKGVVQLADCADRIARTRNLLALVGLFEGQSLTAQGPDVEVRLLRFSDDGVKFGQVIREEDDRTVSEGDLVAVQVTNNSRSALDLTILAIDEDDRVSVFFPAGREDNRVARGGSLITTRHKSQPAADAKKTAAARAHLGLDARPTALERLLVIAVAADGRSTNYGFLASPTIAQARARAMAEGTAERTLDSPLGRLLQNALYAERWPGGIDVQEVQRVALRTLAWRVNRRAH
jgi:hypothetical protein